MAKARLCAPAGGLRPHPESHLRHFVTSPQGGAAPTTLQRASCLPCLAGCGEAGSRRVTARKWQDDQQRTSPSSTAPQAEALT